METITLTKEGLERLVNKTSGTTWEYRQNLINELFKAQEAISNGTYEKEYTQQ